MSAPTSVEVTFPVEGFPTWADCRRVEFGVTEVEWRTYIYGSRVWVVVIAHGVEPDGTSSNCSLHPDRDVLPEWVPQPPQWFWDSVREMRTAVESPEVEASLARTDAFARKHPGTVTS